MKYAVEAWVGFGDTVVVGVYDNWRSAVAKATAVRRKVGWQAVVTEVE